MHPFLRVWRKEFPKRENQLQALGGQRPSRRCLGCGGVTPRAPALLGSPYSHSHRLTVLPAEPERLPSPLKACSLQPLTTTSPPAPSLCHPRTPHRRRVTAAGAGPVPATGLPPCPPVRWPQTMPPTPPPSWHPNPRGSVLNGNQRPGCFYRRIHSGTARPWVARCHTEGTRVNPL